MLKLVRVFLIVSWRIYFAHQLIVWRSRAHHVRAVFGRRSSGISVTWPVHLTWALLSRVWMLEVYARVRTSGSGTMSSFLPCRLYTVHDSHAQHRNVSTTAMYTLTCCFGWLLVVPTLSSSVFKMQSWMWKVWYWLPCQCRLYWRGCFPGRWKRHSQRCVARDTFVAVQAGAWLLSSWCWWQNQSCHKL